MSSFTNFLSSHVFILHILLVGFVVYSHMILNAISIATPPHFLSGDQQSELILRQILLTNLTIIVIYKSNFVGFQLLLILTIKRVFRFLSDFVISYSH
jgi:hypothetical protein